MYDSSAHQTLNVKLGLDVTCHSARLIHGYVGGWRRDGGSTELPSSENALHAALDRTNKATEN